MAPLSILSLIVIIIRLLLSPPMCYFLVGWLVGWFASSITGKLNNRFPQNLVGG